MNEKNKPVLILTCEHASNKLPASFKRAVPARVLKTHRAYDIGAVQVFRKLVKFAKPEFYSEGKFSRLFIDLNRTITNKSAFSEYYEALEARDKAAANFSRENGANLCDPSAHAVRWSFPQTRRYAATD